MTNSPPAYEAAVAREVEKAITSAGYTVKSLAEATTLPRVTIQRCLQGVAPFNTRQLHVIAKELGVPASQFLLAAESDAA